MELDHSIINAPLLNLADPFLLKRPSDFDFEKQNAEVFKNSLIDKMLRLNGVGLSANQLGIDARVFVYGIAGDYLACFNPKIIGASKETCVMKEGCLSAPGLWLMIKRPIAIAMTYQDEKGESKSAEISGMSARVVQHEYDHMEGKTFTMWASPLKIKRALDQMKKKVREHKRLSAQDVNV